LGRDEIVEADFGDSILIGFDKNKSSSTAALIKTHYRVKRIVMVYNLNFQKKGLLQ